MTFDPPPIKSIHMWIYPRIIMSRSPWRHQVTIQKVNTPNDPRWPLPPHLLRSYVCDSTQESIGSNSHRNTSKYVDTVTTFQKTLTKRSMNSRWPLTLLLLRSPRAQLYPSIIVCKSPGNNINVCGYSYHFSKTLTKRSMTPNDSIWPLTSFLLRSQCATLPKDHCF